MGARSAGACPAAAKHLHRAKKEVRVHLVLYLADASDSFAALSGLIFLLFFIGVWVAIGYAIYRGLIVSPVLAMQGYVDYLASRFPNAADGALFKNVYETKQPRNVLVAWLLTFFLSPTISYLYQNKWALAIIAFLTFQGFGIWWVISWFTMPGEVIRYNRNLADQAFNELMMVRPQVAQATAPAASPAIAQWTQPPPRQA
jgi:hypothetical protein